MERYGFTNNFHDTKCFAFGGSPKKLLMFTGALDPRPKFAMNTSDVLMRCVCVCVCKMGR